MAKFQDKVTEYNQYAAIVLHDTVKIQCFQMAFSGDPELLNEIACN